MGFTNSYGPMEYGNYLILPSQSNDKQHYSVYKKKKTKRHLQTTCRLLDCNVCLITGHTCLNFRKKNVCQYRCVDRTSTTERVTKTTILKIFDDLIKEEKMKLRNKLNNEKQSRGNDLSFIKNRIEDLTARSYKVKSVNVSQIREILPALKTDIYNGKKRKRCAFDGSGELILPVIKYLQKKVKE